MAVVFLLLFVVAATKMTWSSEGALALVGDCSWPSSDDCEGFLCLPRWSAKGNSSGLHVSLSYLTCG